MAFWWIKGIKNHSIPTFLLIYLLAACTAFAQRPTALNGFLNAQQWNFREERLALSGDWNWSNFELVDPANSKKGTPVPFPTLWNEVDPQAEGVEGQGYATYTLKALVPTDISEYAIEIPQIYSSYSLWINNRLVAENGKVGKDAESCQPQWKPQTVSFTRDKDTLNIVLQVANFHHSKGGCKEAIYLGESSLMMNKSGLDTSSTWAECGILTLLFGLFLIIYFQRGRKLASLYFALLCLSWAIRSAFSNRYVFISTFPDFDWSIMVRIEYLMLFSTMIWGILFVGRLFENEVNKMLKYGLILVTLSFIAGALVAPPVVFTRWLFIYLSVSGVILFYGFFIVIRAWINEKAGSTWLTVSIIWVIGIFSYDIFSYEGLFTYNSLIFSTGYVVIFSLMGTALLFHMGVFKSTMPPTRLTFEDMYKNSPKA